MCGYANIYEAAQRGQKREPIWGATTFGFWEPSDSPQQRQSIFLTADQFSSLHFRFHNTNEVCLTCLSYHLCESHLWLCNKRMCRIPCVFLTFKVFSFLLCSLKNKTITQCCLSEPHIYLDLLVPPFTWMARICGVMQPSMVSTEGKGRLWHG